MNVFRLCLFSALCASTARSEIVQFNFDDGTLQDWTPVSVEGATSPAYPFASTTATISNRILADSGSYKVMVHNGTDLRGSQHATAILRSPQFTLPANSSISAKLLGGRGIQGSAPASAESLSPNAIQDSANGYAGIALRRNSDKAYVLYGSRTTNGQSSSTNPAYQAVSWSAAQITQATAGDAAGETYSLDFIDNIYGDWGWVALDSVEINRGGAFNWQSQAGNSFELTGTAGKDLKADWSTGPLPETALTLEAWVKVASTGDFALLSAGSASAGGGFVLRNSSNGPYVRLSSSSSTTEVRKTNRSVALKTGAWKHVAVTWSQAEDRVRIFIDGHLYHDKIVPDFSLAFPADSGFHVGSRLGVDGWMSGAIDEVRVWNTALSQQEIQQHMHSFRNGTEAGLIALHALDGLQGTTAPDLSSANRGLAAIGSTQADFKISAARIPDIKPAYRDFIANLNWNVEETIKPGIIRRSHQFTDLFGKSQNLHVLEVDPVTSDSHFELAVLPDGASYRRPSALAQERSSIAAINGSYWHTSGIIANNTPPRDKATRNGVATYTRVNGTTVTDTYEYHAMPNKYFGVPAGSTETEDVDYADDGAVVFDAQGGNLNVVPRPAPHDTTGEFISGWKDYTQWDNAMASGPMLLQGGNVTFRYRNSYEQWNSGEVPWSWQLGDYPFTAAGRKADGKVVLVVGDGRTSTSLGLSVEEVAHVMLALGCTDAIKLDGGGSSAMYVQDRGIVNSPSDGSERSVPSALLVVPNSVTPPEPPPVALDLSGPIVSGDLFYPIQPATSGSIFISATVTRDAASSWTAFGLRPDASDSTSAGGVDFGRNTASTGFALFDYMDHKGASSATARKAAAGSSYTLTAGTYRLIGEVDYTGKTLRAWMWDGTTGSLQFGFPLVTESFTTGFTNTNSLHLRLGSGGATTWTDVKMRRVATSGEREALFNSLVSPGSPVTITVTDADGGETGDTTLEFTVTRTGDLSQPLTVQYTTGGNATSGSDYTALSGSVVIPASLASAVIPVQVLADNEIEGDETLTLTLQDVAVPSSATVTIRDRPLHAYLHANGLQSASADDDGDGVSNILEFYMGTRANDPSSYAGVVAASVEGGVFKARFPRSKAASDVEVTVEWSTDLVNWFKSGESNGTHEAEITRSVISLPEEDPESIEATLTISSGPAPSGVFLRLNVTE